MRPYMVRKRIRGDQSMSLREELYGETFRGIQILHNGEQIYDNEIEVMLLLMEGNDYMKEYVADENGRIVRINYEQIT